jgi:hypothetical protein
MAENVTIGQIKETVSRLLDAKKIIDDEWTLLCP